MNNFKSKFEYEINNTVLFNSIFAVICLSIYSLGLEQFKYAIVPYIAYLVFSRNPDYMPALIIHMIPGNMISILILLLIFVVTINKIKIINQFRIKYIYYLCLSVTPILLVQAFYNLIYRGKSIIDVMIPLSMYFGLFVFFYIFIMSWEGKFNIKHLMTIAFMMFLVLLFNYLYPDEAPIRYIFFSIPLAGSFYFVAKKYYWGNINNSIQICSLILFIYFLIIINQHTFTILLSSLVSIHIIYLHSKENLKSLKFYTSFFMYLITTGFVIYAITNSEEYSIEATSFEVVNYEKISFSDFGELKKRFLSKAFDDRAPLWKAIWFHLLSNPKWMPSTNTVKYVITNNSGAELEYDIPAHNLFLELLKNYGIIVGVISIVNFCALSMSAAKVLLTKNLHPIVISLAAVFVSISIIGSMTGQFLMLSTFSMLYFGLGGFFYYEYARKAVR